MTKSCALKTGQKVFFLQLDQASSCCRSYPIALSQHQSIASVLDLWAQQSAELDHGHEVADCAHCWRLEQQGVTSYRQQQSHSWHQKNVVELFVNNTCNQMCSYCSPKFSSTWQQSIEQQGMFDAVSATTKLNLLPQQAPVKIDYWLEQIRTYVDQCPDNSVELALVGGEPLMQMRSLEQLLLANLTKIKTLRITTNLNPPNPKFLHWVLEHFPRHKLFFSISLDTVPEHNAVPRAGFDPDQFQHNLELLQNCAIDFVLLSVISVLNIFSLAQYQQWCKQNSYKVEFFRLNNPDCLEPMYIDGAFGSQLLMQDLPELAKQALMQQPNQLDIKQFEQYNYLDQYFKRTNTVITHAHLAEYWQWLQKKFQ